MVAINLHAGGKTYAYVMSCWELLCDDGCAGGHTTSISHGMPDVRPRCCDLAAPACITRKRSLVHKLTACPSPMCNFLNLYKHICRLSYEHWEAFVKHFQETLDEMPEVCCLWRSSCVAAIFLLVPPVLQISCLPFRSLPPATYCCCCAAATA